MTMFEILRTAEKPCTVRLGKIKGYVDMVQTDSYEASDGYSGSCGPYTIGVRFYRDEPTDSEFMSDEWEVL